MRKLIVLLLAFTVTCAVAQEKKKGEWKELKEFHSIMSKTFHPSEEGNLQPLKDQASVLTAKAKVWAATKVPAGYDKALTPQVLKELVDKCEEIEYNIKKKVSDDELKALIAEAHEIFHKVVEKCRMPEKDEHHAK